MNKEEQEFKKEVDETLQSIYSKINEEEKIFLSYVVNQFNNICERNNKAIEYGELIDNRNTYIEISELRHLVDILKGNNEEE